MASGFNLLGGSGGTNLSRASFLDTYDFVTEYRRYETALIPNNGVASTLATFSHIQSRLMLGDNVFKIFSLSTNNTNFIYVVSSNGTYINMQDADTILSDGNMITFAGEPGGPNIRERGMEFTVQGGTFTENLNYSLYFD